ncbi:MAG TPA: hypothetical protein VKR58_13505, partial [Aquella sp.]|nr:hypothetical protein [Aquella sp.]
AGGIKAKGWAIPAREEGSYLIKWGFKTVAPDKNGNYDFHKGDIVVIQGYPGGTADKNGVPYGHIMMFDGTQWVSDFKQNVGGSWPNGGFWPGPGYRKYKPAFTVYRWGGN